MGIICLKSEKFPKMVRCLRLYVYITSKVERICLEEYWLQYFGWAKSAFVYT